jgi:kynurenine formamidase
MTKQTQQAGEQPGNWKKWGEADERGSANYVDEERTRLAASLVKRGRVFSLAFPLDGTVPVFPRRGPPVHLMSVDGGDYAAGLRRKGGTQTADDYLGIYVQSGTHIDGLCHVWYDDQIYNGFSSDEIRSGGARKCGIEKLGHLCARAVLLDLCRQAGTEHLPAGHVITPEQLQACASKQGVALTTGDVLLIRTGWMSVFDPAQSKPFFAGEPGLGIEAARWLGELGVAAIGMDNFAVEVVPHEVDDVLMPVHRLLLRDYGCYLMEMMKLDELAAAQVYEGMFVAAPLLITGGTGSPLNPLFIC